MLSCIVPGIRKMILVRLALHFPIGAGIFTSRRSNPFSFACMSPEANNTYAIRKAECLDKTPRPS